MAGAIVGPLAGYLSDDDRNSKHAIIAYKY